MEEFNFAEGGVGRGRNSEYRAAHHITVHERTVETRSRIQDVFCEATKYVEAGTTDLLVVV